MAAGLGFKDFVTGEVLTAADVDGYLMQGVWVFASAAARDAAVTAPAEGNFAYLKDTNVTTYYTGSAWANLDTTGMTNPMTTTGDIIYSSPGSTPVRLGIGSTGNVLTVASGVPSWAAPAGGSTFVGCSLYKTSNQTISNATNTAISFQAENFDTDTFHDNSTNNTRITIPAGKGGKYLITGSIAWSTGANERVAMIYKNGTIVNYMAQEYPANLGGFYHPFNYVISLVATDYIELFCNQGSGGNLSVFNGVDSTTFSATYLGA